MLRRDPARAPRLKPYLHEPDPELLDGAIGRIPMRMISLTLIEHAEPLINHLGDGCSKSDLERILNLAACVWNACVLGQWHATTEHVEAVRQQISKVGNSIPSAIVEALIAGKQQRFGNNPRGTTNECVLVKRGEFAVRAAARLDVQNVEVEAGWAK
jgi:hypothetical protein